MTQPLEIAYVEIVAKTDDFDRNLDKDTKKSFDKVKNTAKAATASIVQNFRNAGRDIDSVFRNQVRTSVSSVREDLDRVGTTGTRAFKEIRNTVSETGTQFRELSTAILGPFNIFSRIAKIGPSGIGLLTSGFFTLAAAVAAAAQVIQNFITIAAFGLAGLPAVISGVIASVLTLRAAFSGIGDAFKELTEEQNTAGAAGVSNARAVADAQRGLLQAQKDLIQAKEDEIDRIRTLAIEIQRARATEARAADDVLKAEYALQRAREVGTPRAQIEAQLALDEARATLVESKKDTQDLAAEKAKADKNGVNGSEQVLRAQEALLDAQDRLAAAQQTLTAGAAAQRQAFNGLTKSAQDFVLALVDAQEQLGPIKDAIQEAFFQGTGPLLQPIVDNIKELEPDLVGLSKAFGDVFKEILEFLGSPEAKDSMKSLLGGLTDFITAITPSIGPLLTAFASLVGDSGELGKTLGEKVAEGLDAIAKFVREVDIEQLFKDAKEAVKELVPLVRGLVVAFKAVFDILAFFGKYILPLILPQLNFVADVFRTLGDILSGLPDVMSDAWKGLTDGIAGVTNTIGKLPGKIMALGGKFLAAGKSLITSFFDGLGRAGGFATDFAKNLASTFIRFFNQTVIASINKGIKTIQTGLNRIPGLSFTLPTLSNIPALEKGGLITGDSIFRGGERGRKEAVLPLEDSTVMAKIGNAIANAGGIGNGVVFGEGAFSMNFYGAIPTPAQARNIGTAIGQAAANEISRRNIRATVRGM